MSFRGARAFAARALPELLDALNRFARDVADQFQELDRGTARRWKYLPLATGASAVAAHDYILPVNPTGSLCSVVLPAVSEENAGRELGILRTTVAPLIELNPGAALIDGANAIVSVPNTVGLYVWVADTSGHWRRR